MAKLTEIETPKVKSPKQTPKKNKEEVITPAKVVKTPAKASKSPAKTDKTPVKASKSPAKADKTPAKADKTPAKADKTPAKADKTPAKTDKTPAKTDKTPAKADKTPAKADKTPAPASPKKNGSTTPKRKRENDDTSEQSSAKKACVTATVHVMNIPKETSEKTLKKLFSQFGKVMEVRLPLKDNQRPKALVYGFVSFSDDESVKKAQKMSDKLEIDGKALKIAPAKPKVEIVSTNKFHLKFISNKATIQKELLEKHFGKFGKLKYLKTIKKKGKYGGYVQFAGFKDLTAALAKPTQEGDGFTLQVTKEALNEKTNKVEECEEDEDMEEEDSAGEEEDSDEEEEDSDEEEE